MSDFTPTIGQLIDAWGSDRDGFPLPDDRDGAARAIAINEAEARRREREEIAGWLESEADRENDIAERLRPGNTYATIGRIEASGMRHIAQTIRNGDHYKEES